MAITVEFRMRTQTGNSQNFHFSARAADNVDHLVKCAINNYQSVNRCVVQHTHICSPYMFDVHGNRYPQLGPLLNVLKTCDELRKLAGMLGLNTQVIPVYIDLIVR